MIQFSWDVSRYTSYRAFRLIIHISLARRVFAPVVLSYIFCAAYGRLIFDEEDGSSDDKKQAGRFPDLCLPGEYYKVYKGTWTCSCQQTQEPGVHKFRCILAEDQLSPQQLGRGKSSDSWR